MVAPISLKFLLHFELFQKSFYIMRFSFKKARYFKKLIT